MKRMEKLHRQERNLQFLEDVSVLNGLLIFLMALIFLMDIARYQWLLLILMILGILLNLTLALTEFIRKRWISSVIALLLAVGLSAALVYLGFF